MFPQTHRALQKILLYTWSDFRGRSLVRELHENLALQIPLRIIRLIIITLVICVTDLLRWFNGLILK